MIKNKDILEELFVFDAHCDTANVLYDSSSYFIKDNKRHFTIEKAKTTAARKTSHSGLFSVRGYLWNSFGSRTDNPDLSPE